ncbi:hypothetical protein [Nitratifractor sp.]
MRSRIWVIAVVAFFASLHLWARGTEAGTVVENRAVLILRERNETIPSLPDRFVVDRIVDIQIAWDDAQAVEVSPSETDRILHFTLRNDGNAEDNISLSHRHRNTPVFTPPPANPRIILDRNRNGIYDADTDPLINSVVLPPDTNASLLLLCDIPDSPEGNRSREALVARSDANATEGPDRQEALDVVVRSGRSRAVGTYRLRDYALKAVKSALIHSDDGALHTGTRITYTIVVTIEGGAGEIDDVELHDSIPEGSVYVPGSLRLDGTALSDAADGDAGRYDSEARTIFVRLGDLIQHRPHQVRRVVLFDVRIP